MEKHIFTQQQCHMLNGTNILKLKHTNTHLVTGGIPVYDNFYTTDLLNLLPKALKIHRLTCTLVLIRTFIPEDPHDPEQPFKGWVWEAGYSASCSDDFEEVGIGEDLADALLNLFLNLCLDGIISAENDEQDHD